MDSVSLGTLHFTCERLKSSLTFFDACSRRAFTSWKYFCCFLGSRRAARISCCLLSVRGRGILSGMDGNGNGKWGHHITHTSTTRACMLTGRPPPSPGLPARARHYQTGRRRARPAPVESGARQGVTNNSSRPTRTMPPPNPRAICRPINAQAGTYHAAGAPVVCPLLLGQGRGHDEGARAGGRHQEDGH